MGHMKDLDRRIRQGGDDAIAAVGELLPRWISVEERLPELDWDGMSTQILVATADRMTWIGRYEKDEHGERWYIDTTQPVVAWMPLPEPPEAKPMLTAEDRESIGRAVRLTLKKMNFLGGATPEAK